ncbi:MAG: TetR/AcrR family transcriptional regulator [Acidobacteria bacterium]|nr:TetR/AcrR family transcriptional regulator [Candidatus Sulfomarinibacter sp. MAG AM1]
MPRKTTTRERLIGTAAELFWKQGYAQTGVNEIIQQAQATSGSFYHFFPTKEDLLLAVVDHVAEIFETEVFGPASEAGGSGVERLFAVLERYRQRLLDSGFVFGSPMGSLAAEVSENHPLVNTRLVEIQTAWTERIEGLLMDAGNQLPRDLDRGSVARFVVSAMEGAALQSRVSRNLALFDASVAQLRNFFSLLEPPERHVEPIPAQVRERPRMQAQATDWRSW